MRQRGFKLGLAVEEMGHLSGRRVRVLDDGKLRLRMA
jgi:hypothetical protein